MTEIALGRLAQALLAEQVAQFFVGASVERVGVAVRAWVSYGLAAWPVAFAPGAGPAVFWLSAFAYAVAGASGARGSVPDLLLQPSKAEKFR